MLAARDATDRPRAASTQTSGSAGDPAAAHLSDLQRLVRNAPHPIAVTTGGSHHLTGASTAFCRAVGLDPTRATDHRIEQLFRGESGADVCTLLDRCFRSGEPVETQYTPADARQEPWRLTAWAFADAAGTPEGVVIELTARTLSDTAVHESAESIRHESDDIADQIREINSRLLQAALEEQEWADRAEAANRAKSEFLAMVSHELRTPLTGIVAYTDLLLEPNVLGPLTDRQRGSLQRIEACSDHLHQLVEDLITYATVESGSTDIRVQRVDVAELAREAAAVVEPLATKKGLSITTRLPADALIAETDGRRLRQILVNLIGNAVKFTDEGGICIAGAEEGGMLRLDVEDTGIGIDEADLARIFEPFVQAEPITTRMHGGTGLGLAISRDLARLLGGDVVVSSTRGAGSTFTLRLPRSPHSTAA